MLAARRLCRLLQGDPTEKIHLFRVPEPDGCQGERPLHLRAGLVEAGRDGALQVPARARARAQVPADEGRALAHGGHAQHEHRTQESAAESHDS